MLTRQRSALLLPLCGFLLVFFVAPLVWLLSLAVREAEVPRAPVMAVRAGFAHVTFSRFRPGLV
jgi:hypothetical protein